MTDNCTSDGEDLNLSIPRGGPIYVRDMAGVLTKGSNFEASVIEELERLRLEVSEDLFDVLDTDLCVDDLGIIAEDELVNKAFEEAFKDVVETGKSLEASGEQPHARGDDLRISSSEQACSEGSGVTQDASVPYDESLNRSLVRIDGNGKSSRKVPQKRKRRHPVNQQNRHAEKESYIERVEQLAKIKQKQDDDKVAACLHSFNGGRGVNRNTKASASGMEKMEALKSRSTAIKVRQSSIHECIPVIHPELVFCVEVYHNKRPAAKTQEFLVLGCQPLSELKDSIYCLTDVLMTKAGQYDPSGYLLIEDVFYNDMRDPSAIDYSKPIFDWLQNSEDEACKKWQCLISGEVLQKEKALSGGGATNSQVPRFRCAEMQKSCFRDLRFRLGAGYLYCHQGDCKHLIVIRDVRLIHPEDVQNRAAYPITTYQSKLRFQKCSVCKIFRAEKVTVDDKWAQENPCYFCKNCYYMLHYESGSLLYDEFSVYDYHHE